MARLGARQYVEKPFAPLTLERAIQRALSQPPNLVPCVRGGVGQLGLREMEDQVRRSMVEEALSRSAGSRRSAARLLNVTRQTLQHILRKLELE
jgi:DNA-binding NtrC family response regulator